MAKYMVPQECGATRRCTLGKSDDRKGRGMLFEMDEEQWNDFRTAIHTA